MVCRHYDWKSKCINKSKCYKKSILITDHNYENVIAISTKLMLMKGKLHHIKSKGELVDKGYLNAEVFKYVKTSNKTC
jgi:ABC-type Mn2+/Zn2+ transport system ATPase subunit